MGEREEREGIWNKVAGKKARGMKIFSLSPSVGWRNTAWLATVNTEPVTTTTNHRLSGVHTDTHTACTLSLFCSLFMDTQWHTDLPL